MKENYSIRFHDEFISVCETYKEWLTARYTLRSTLKLLGYSFDVKIDHLGFTHIATFYLK